MLATEHLRQDHQVILRLLAVLEKASVQIRGGTGVPRDFMGKALSVVKNFVDRCHHEKEEE
jgi:hemerythrin-like domain-containing protein